MLLIYLLNFVISQIILPGSLMLGDLAVKTTKHSLPTISIVTETTVRNQLEENTDDPDDPAIYLHPEAPHKSLIITSHKKGGLRVHDLMGQEIQTISPDKIRYNNVDIVSGVKYQSQIAGETKTCDLAIASDRHNDTIAIFLINRDYQEETQVTTSLLENVTSIEIPSSIFGVDDGIATAYGLTSYTSIVDGKTYVFVSQSDGNKIAQLELQPEIGAADQFTVNAKIVRTWEMPIPPGLTPEEAFVEGMVVDRETGILYLAQEQFGIWKLKAEPDSTLDLTIVDRVKNLDPNSPLTVDVEGLTIYYGDHDQGYLIASSQGDNTFAVYQRAEDNTYVGSFVIEGVGKTDGLDITSLPLGEKYPAGLLVVQDGLNQPIPNFKLINVAEVIAVLKSNAVSY